MMRINGRIETKSIDSHISYLYFVKSRRLFGVLFCTIRSNSV